MCFWLYEQFWQIRKDYPTQIFIPKTDVLMGQNKPAYTLKTHHLKKIQGITTPKKQMSHKKGKKILFKQKSLCNLKRITAEP